MTEFEDDATFELRQTAVAAVLGMTHEDLVSYSLATHLDENPQMWGDRMYQRLEALPVKDLALAIVMALKPEADARANELWSHLCTDRAEDFR